MRMDCTRTPVGCGPWSMAGGGRRLDLDLVMRRYVRDAPRARVVVVRSVCRCLNP
jgi:hypothetical protein